MKKRITQDDYIKANRKASREAEIEQHGHPVCYKRVHETKKVYNRKKIKAANEKLPSFFALKRVTPSFQTLWANQKEVYSIPAASTPPSRN